VNIIGELRLSTDFPNSRVSNDPIYSRLLLPRQVYFTHNLHIRRPVCRVALLTHDRNNKQRLLLRSLFLASDHIRPSTPIESDAKRVVHISPFNSLRQI
jgi:hypothetical protein